MYKNGLLFLSFEAAAMLPGKFLFRGGISTDCLSEFLEGLGGLLRQHKRNTHI